MLLSLATRVKAVVDDLTVSDGVKDGCILVWRFVIYAASIGNYNYFKFISSLASNQSFGVSLVIGAGRIYSGSADNTIDDDDGYDRKR